MRSVSPWLTMGAFLLVQGCAREIPAEGYVLLHIDTDAPLPGPCEDEKPAPTSQSINLISEPRGVFDRLVVHAHGVEEETFDIERQDFCPLGASLAIVPVDKSQRTWVDIVLRRRTSDVGALFKSILLPAPGQEGQSDAWTFLATDEAEPAPQYDTGEPWGVSRVGSWIEPHGETPGEGVREGEVFVPGGAFWMGDPELPRLDETEAANREFLVVLDSFYIDAQEVTVALLREKWDERAAGCDVRDQSLAERFGDAILMRGRATGTCEDVDATFGVDREHDLSEYPVNGVPWALAQEYCCRQGKSLPSEAQFEYVASGLGSEWDYPWGSDMPDCSDALINRGPCDSGTNTACRRLGRSRSNGPERPGQYARDSVNIVDETGAVHPVVDLAGNLSEWVLDTWVEQSVIIEALNPVPKRRRNPVRRGDGQYHVYKGGSYAGNEIHARAAARNKAASAVAALSRGFRCVRAAGP